MGSTAGGAPFPPSNDGAVCEDDGNPCTDDICSNGACTHPPGNDGAPCEDDENRCADDICENGSCVHPPAAECTACATVWLRGGRDEDGWCVDESCVLETCCIAVESGIACPGGSVELELTASCAPDCWEMTVSVDRQPQHAAEKWNPSGRSRVFEYNEIIKRDEVNLDIFRLKDESVEYSTNLPDPDMIAEEIVEDLQAALDQFMAISTDLEES